MIDDKVSLEGQEPAGREVREGDRREGVVICRVPDHTRDIIFYTEAEAITPAYRALRLDLEVGPKGSRASLPNTTKGA